MQRRFGICADDTCFIFCCAVACRHAWSGTTRRRQYGRLCPLVYRRLCRRPSKLYPELFILDDWVVDLYWFDLEPTARKQPQRVSQTLPHWQHYFIFAGGRSNHVKWTLRQKVYVRRKDSRISKSLSFNYSNNNNNNTLSLSDQQHHTLYILLFAYTRVIIYFHKTSLTACILTFSSIQNKVAIKIKCSKGWEDFEK